MVRIQINSGLIGQLKEQSIKGYLKKMFDHVITKFKENENISDINPAIARTSYSAFHRSSVEISLDVK